MTKTTFLLLIYRTIKCRLNNRRIVLVVKPILAVLLAIGKKKRELAFLQPVARPLKRKQENR
ncbi:hypothetical protein PN480_20280 [Dolichospermum circinale CS-1225]|uniref:hypothetical protein n=1 Tax=Dolichospermum circinale TaxID=109265 RepID=UPI00232CDEC7|nr:hypothetical protein [Dolichospermum circinale]MDB9457297.1 hypothetical protein [Dolichospermum circinale CS-545/17]MDB9466794.1 hypothetical protein [Dolichospermum circinale CS-539/09]MDB9472476.1 hypothetical protein [Dolichospermum circinale CS-539]MDB9524263.1 hypothetical protein [Dolichospermum circinale CS-1225]